MTQKTLIVSALGEEKLWLPSLVKAALTANDRVKYLFMLLQTARSHADHPNLAGIDVAAGLLTAFGGRTSHAAVVTRRLRLGEHSQTEGDSICVDGESGHVYAGCPRIEHQRPLALLAEVARWKAASAQSGASANSA